MTFISGLRNLWSGERLPEASAEDKALLARTVRVIGTTMLVLGVLTSISAAVDYVGLTGNVFGNATAKVGIWSGAFFAWIGSRLRSRECLIP